ncbi:DUF4212 domain-containing protein [Akkermansiaceae bacterium]|nr:DUF4212 domain-containing protein [Akkermansiaceae bacterium]
MMSENQEQGSARSHYWKANLGWLAVLLGAWFIVSLGSGILWRDWLDLNFPKVGTAPFGFWMAQQGSIISFVLILIAYDRIMARLDAKFNKEGASK